MAEKSSHPDFRVRHHPGQADIPRISLEIGRRELIKLSAASAGALVLPAVPTAETPGVPGTVHEAQLPPGVRAEWNLKKAHSEKTATRERICINGLWRWQPLKSLAHSIPESWGWFKVPGCWPGISDYLQKDCQTAYLGEDSKDVNLRDVSIAWYQREVRIPADWKGRRISLSLEYVNTFATVFIGKANVGEIRFPAGELDITSHCAPGEPFILSILVQASPLQAVILSYTDTNGAREVKGSVERRGLCGDAWLTSIPTSATITDVKINTSVTRGEISFDVALAGLSPGTNYELHSLVTDVSVRPGSQTIAVVHNGLKHLFTAAELKNGRFTVTEKWKPDRLWDIHTPQNQFTASLSLSAGGKLLDRALPVRFGFREFEIRGKDFYLNGTRIYCPSLPLDNAQVGAAWASYEGAKETLERFKSMGMYFLYTHNYSCEPGVHLSFSEILRAADDVGMLISFAQPHFSNYDWKAPDADSKNGYARHAEFYVRAAQNHPSVVAYSMSHNATGYVEEANPDMIDGIQDPREDWGRRNSILALRAEAIVKRFDPGRIVYHHSSGNLGSMHTCNFYVNFVPVQELSDWFEHWETKGVKPLFLCEYGVPCTWDWTMYRGWYKGHREWGSAQVSWEFCIAEWNAQFVGDRAYQIGEREKANLRWEAARFKAGQLWHRWDYPTQVGSPGFPDTNAVFHDYVTDNWRAYRMRGVSGFGPWEYEMYWSLKGDADHSRKQLAVDWDNLQRPGFSADYIDDRPSNIALGYQRSDWLPTPAGTALLRNNMPLLAFIGGKPNAVTSKDHNFLPGETVEKQLIVINNSRVPVKCECVWSSGVPATAEVRQTVTVATGEQARLPINFKLPDSLAEAGYTLKASVRFDNGGVQRDEFAFHVTSRPRRTKTSQRIGLYDPHGSTATQLGNIDIKRVTTDDDLANFDLLIIGKAALTTGGPAPNLTRVRDGLKVVMLEQIAEVLEQRFGFRIAEYGMRNVFQRQPGHLLHYDLTGDNLRDWRGESTLLAPRLKYTIGDRYSPQVKWCGLDVTRVWRCGNRGSVASALIEKPACGDFSPIIDCGYGLQYSALMEYREGKGMVLFCQMDVSGRTETDPAAEQLLQNILAYTSRWKPTPRRAVLYAGEAAGKAYFKAAGFIPDSLTAGKIPADTVIIAGPGFGSEVAGREREIRDWLADGGHLLAFGLEERDARIITPTIEMKAGEHISAHFEPQLNSSLFAGVCPADVHNRDPRTIPLVSGGADILGNGVLAKAGNLNVVFCQIAPWQFDSRQPMNQKRTFRHAAFLASRLAGNMGAKCSTPLLKNIATPAAQGDKRWLDGLYLDIPEEWDDPYRFFGW